MLRIKDKLILTSIKLIHSAVFECKADSYPWESQNEPFYHYCLNTTEMKNETSKQREKHLKTDNLNFYRNAYFLLSFAGLQI